MTPAELVKTRADLKTKLACLEDSIQAERAERAPRLSERAAQDRATLAKVNAMVAALEQFATLQAADLVCVDDDSHQVGQIEAPGKTVQLVTLLREQLAFLVVGFQNRARDGVASDMTVERALLKDQTDARNQLDYVETQLADQRAAAQALLDAIDGAAS